MQSGHGHLAGHRGRERLLLGDPGRADHDADADADADADRNDDADLNADSAGPQPDPDSNTDSNPTSDSHAYLNPDPTDARRGAVRSEQPVGTRSVVQPDRSRLDRHLG
jgi:hypothetical protein